MFVAMRIIVFRTVAFELQKPKPCPRSAVGREVFTKSVSLIERPRNCRHVTVNMSYTPAGLS